MRFEVLASRFNAIIFLMVCFLTTVPAASGQGNLQVGMPVERTISAGQTHIYHVDIKQDQVLVLVVQQKGIEVGIRASSPPGQWLGDFDSSNGNAGTTSIALVAE